MEQNIVIAGATFNGVPSVEIPTSGGGSASFVEVSDTTATASDVAQGKYFYTANGVKTAGTGEGSGGGLPLQEKTATANGIVIPDAGYAGLMRVLVEVNGTSGTPGTYAGGGVPSNSLGSDGDYYYKRIAQDRLIWFDTTTTASASRSGGYTFQTGQDSIVIYGLSICPAVGNQPCHGYLCTPAGDVISSVYGAGPFTANAWNDLYFDNPVTLDANTGYLVWYSQNNSYLRYTREAVDASPLTITGKFESTVLNQKPTQTTSVIFGVDLIYPGQTALKVISEYFKTNGEWSQIT